MSWTRRRMLHAGGVLAGVSVASLMRPGRSFAGASMPAATRVKRVSLLNLHTNEHLELDFYRDGTYVEASLSAIQILMRDFRNGEQHPIDPTLMDYLYDAARNAGVDPVFSIISGYRSPQTNEQLRERSNGVARHSLHLEGRAVDVRLKGVNCADLANNAHGMSRGGVGYYQESDFVHLDTGNYRTWSG